MFMTYTEMFIGVIILCLMVGGARKRGLKEGMKHALETLNLTPQQIAMLNEELKKT
tara:strand:- start:36 stop:203 length:168 start_codon:yes stop_codon:yes gene_type:complete